MKCAIILSLSLCGCYSADSVLTLDKEFTYEEAQIIRAAAAEWKEATGGAVDLMVESDVFSYDRPFTNSTWRSIYDTAVIFRIHDDEPGAIDIKKDYTNILFGAALEGDFCNVALFIDNFATKDLFKVTIHELGHHIGIVGHLPSGIMTPHIDLLAEDCIDETTINYYCSHFECGSGKHSTCKR